MKNRSSVADETSSATASPALASVVVYVLVYRTSPLGSVISLMFQVSNVFLLRGLLCGVSADDPSLTKPSIKRPGRPADSAVKAPPPAVARSLAPCRSWRDRLKARIESINSIAAVWLQFKVDRGEAVETHSRIKLCWFFWKVSPVAALVQVLNGVFL